MAQHTNSAEGSVASLWTRYRDTAVVYRSEQYAKFTLPYLMVDPLRGGSPNQLEHDFQSLGALLVNNLSSKITQALFPPGLPYFRISTSPELEAAADAEGLEPLDLAGRMAKLEQAATEQVFLHGGQHKLTRAVKLLIVTGNVMLYRDPVRKKFMTWSVQSYGVRRSATGEVMDAVLKQRFRWSDLPEQNREYVMANRPGGYTDQSEVDLYTRIEASPSSIAGGNSTVQVTHEIDGVLAADPVTYPEHLSPYLFPTWNLADGEDYGRGLVEDYAGDFARMSLVTEQLGLYELESLNILNLVDESAGGVVDDYQSADTGSYVPGKVGAVSAYERGDYNKIAAVSNALAQTAQRLSTAFMHTSNMRDAERVTAEEVRRIAREAEGTFGGVYSTLASALQAPLAYLSMVEIAEQNDGLLMGLIHKDIRPAVVTGIPAMTRAVETENLLRATQEAAAIIPQLVQMSRRIDPERVLEKIFQGNSVSLDDISKSPDQLAEEARQQAAAAQAQEQAASAAVAGAAGEVQDALQEIA